MKVLVDTNILLDVLQARKPHDGPALRLWEFVEKRQLDGFVSAISFNNVYYVARRQVGREQALEAVKLIRGAFRTVSLDEVVIDRAIALNSRDFEDAIQAAAAARIKAAFVVTRNVSDFLSVGVSAITAEELVAFLGR